MRGRRWTPRPFPWFCYSHSNMWKLTLLSFILGGYSLAQPAYCLVSGVSIPVINAPITDIGQATLYQGRPVIFFNPQWAVLLPSNVVTFFLYHECGHHALGHTLGFGFPLSNEQAADCWAAQALVSTGNFNESDIRAVQAAITRFGRGDWTHLPGPVRAMNLGACLSSAPSPSERPARNTGPTTGSLTCTVTQQEIDNADISRSYSSAMTSRDQDTVRDAITEAQDELTDAVSECRMDLDNLRDDPTDRFWRSEVRSDRDSIASLRRTIRALQQRLTRPR